MMEPINEVATELLFTKTEGSMKANGKMIRDMVMGMKFSLIKILITAGTATVKRTDKASTHG